MQSETIPSHTKYSPPYPWILWGAHSAVISLVAIRGGRGWMVVPLVIFLVGSVALILFLLTTGTKAKNDDPLLQRKMTSIATLALLCVSAGFFVGTAISGGGLHPP